MREGTKGGVKNISKTITCITMLRGINVSGHKKIKMYDLKALYDSLGFQNVRTYIQSGNVVFECEEPEASAVAGNIESAIEKKYNFHVPVIIRTPDEFQKIIEANPFLKGEPKDAKFFAVCIIPFIAE